MTHKFAIRMAAAMVAGLAVLSSCSDDGPDGDGNGGNGTGGNKSLKLEKLDISGAKSLTLMGIPSKSRDAQVPNTLFKIDENGNMSAVTLHVIEDGEGNKSTERTDITVHPDQIFSLSGKYTYMVMCEFRDKEGNVVYFNYNDDSGYWDFNVLVANATGKIYYIPAAGREYFSTYRDNSAVDKMGNLYLQGPKVARLTFSDDRAVLTPYGPDGFGSGGSMYVLDNGVVAIQNYHNAISFLYPNGGFEHLSGASDNPRENGTTDTVQKDRYSFNIIDGKVYAAKRPKENFMYEWYSEGYENGDRYIHREISASIHTVNVGEFFGHISYSEPLATITGTNDALKHSDYNGMYSWDAPDWTWFARIDEGRFSPWESNRYYFLGDLLAYDKQNGGWTDLVATKKMDFARSPNPYNTYNGKCWEVYRDWAYWFNPETLEHGSVKMPDICSQASMTEQDIPNGKIYYTAISNFDGSRKLYTIDIETGDYTVSDLETEDHIITLIPLN